MKLSHLFARPLVAAAVLIAPVFAADNYKVDSEHASVVFKVDHLGVAPAYGRFNDPTGTIVLDKENLSKSTFTFELKTENVDTHNEKRDAHLKSPDFFDAKQFPTITFKSKSVKADGDKFAVTGDLTLHGVTKEIVVPLVKTGEKDTGRMGYRTGWVAEVGLKRSEYGMKGMIGPIGDDVHLTISFEAVKS